MGAIAVAGSRVGWRAFKVGLGVALFALSGWLHAATTVTFRAQQLSVPVDQVTTTKCVQVGLFMDYAGDAGGWAQISGKLAYTLPSAGFLAGAPFVNISDFSYPAETGITNPGTPMTNSSAAMTPCSAADIINSATLGGAAIDFAPGDGSSLVNESVNTVTRFVDFVSLRFAGMSFYGADGGSYLMAVVEFPLAAGQGSGTIDLTWDSTPLSNIISNGVTTLSASLQDGRVTVTDPPPGFAKVFAPDAIASGAVSTLTFAIDNSSGSLDATSLDFTDNLPAAVTVATPASASTTCTGGTLTAAAGSGTVSYTGGTVGAGSSCTVTVDVTATTVGAHVNTSGALTSSLGDSGSAGDTLTVVPAPGFAKVFDPDTIASGGISTLTFTIDNGASSLAATSLDFTDNLPAAVTVATPANASTTCTGGTLTAAAGSGTVSYTDGAVGAGSSCTVAVDVTATTVGAHENLTGDLVSSLGNSGTAYDTLTVVPAPGFAKVFSPDTIGAGGTSTLTFTIDNSASGLAATNLGFVDNLPAGLAPAIPSSFDKTCVGGVLQIIHSAPAVVSYSGGTVAAGSTCTIWVDFTATTPGEYVNTSGALTSSLGDSGSATDTLTVVPLPAFGAAFGAASVLVGDTVTLTFTIDNSGSSVAASGLAFSGDVGSALRVADPANAAVTCNGGVVTAPPGGSAIAYGGGSVDPGTVCTVSVDLAVVDSGEVTFTPGALGSSLGSSSASATVLVISPAAVPGIGLAGLFLLALSLAGAAWRRGGVAGRRPL